MFNPKVGSKALEMVSVRDILFKWGRDGMISSIVLILLYSKRRISIDSINVHPG